MPGSRLVSLVVWTTLVAVPGRAVAQTGSGPAAEPRVTMGAGITAASKYIWRGFDEEAGASLQPSVWISTAGLTFTAWSNVAMRGGKGLTEQDLSAEYARTVGTFSIRAGWNGYFLPDARDSHEAFVALSREGWLSPTLAVYQDYREGRGTYVSAAVSHSIDWGTKPLSLVPSLGLGYNRHQWTERVGFSDLNVGLKLVWRHRSERLELAPFINYSHTLNVDMLPSRTYGGLEITIK